ncbi:MAG: hypothetical protein U9P49_06410 [Thermodesulfobacteriota bacterium]|nr:hypothetical protein [Thermodesulfobacteriota bacterium]
MPLSKHIIIMEEGAAGKKEDLYGPAPSTAKGVAASQDDGIMI